MTPDSPGDGSSAESDCAAEADEGDESGPDEEVVAPEEALSSAAPMDAQPMVEEKTSTIAQLVIRQFKTRAGRAKKLPQHFRSYVWM